ncbi:uncharacterized protein LOC128965559 [Oppia nitens]|uniref:uncharacterized protein LOC128965559 n=1 Tax=Oppia nitens TaxID=1686743 RepID=UPI0023D9AD0C|nr:uncharacterized protein LOC128965559 [Oppia nitens]
MKIDSIGHHFISFCLILALIKTVESIKCYQCSSDEDPEGEDNCGAYQHFDQNKNIAVECMGEEALTPGTFCFKSIQQGPRGFIWDGRWRTVIRRCAQVSERGISWGCDWGYKDNGVYWEECYCAEDSCNGSTSVGITLTTVFISLIVSIVSIYLITFTHY